METVPALGIDAILRERDIAKIMLLSCLVKFSLHIYLRITTQYMGPPVSVVSRLKLQNSHNSAAQHTAYSSTN